MPDFKGFNIDILSIFVWPFPKRQILDCTKLKEFADDNFKFDEKCRKFTKWVENTAGKGEIVRYEQFLLFQQCFQKTLLADTLKPGLVWERVKHIYIASIEQQVPTYYGNLSRFFLLVTIPVVAPNVLVNELPQSLHPRPGIKLRTLWLRGRRSASRPRTPRLNQFCPPTWPVLSIAYCWVPKWQRESQVLTSIMTNKSFLTLSQTSPGLYVSAIQIFWKQFGKRRNCS